MVHLRINMNNLVPNFVDKQTVKTPTGRRQAALSYIQSTAKELNSGNHLRTIQ